MAGYNVRFATPTDNTDITELLNKCLLTAEGVADNITNFLVARSSMLDGVVGLEMNGSAVLIRSLAVRPGKRGKGIGKALLDKALKVAREKGAVTAYLLTNTAEDYFRGWGFETIQRGEIPEPLLQSSALGRLCPSSSVCMRMVLEVFVVP